jgi:putative ABC transport system substrate-binding protein
LRRRDFIALLGAAAFVWPLAARAQQPAVPVIGYLSGGLQGLDSFRVSAFQQGLNESGYTVGRNVTIEFRWANNLYDQLPALAGDLVRHQVAVIAASGIASALAAKAATATIPIVFASGADPVKFGLVGSLNRPGGNVTGVNFLAGALEAKRLELLHELVPASVVIAVLVNPNGPNASIQLNDIREAARRLGQQIVVVNASDDHDIDTAFATLAQQRPGALLVSSDAYFNTQHDKIAALTVRHAMPAIHELGEFAAAGGLMSYGTSLADANRLAGFYVGRVLKGDKPADLPVQQSTKVELVINLKAAKALGLAIPLPLLGRADEVIE